jgi:hypothetical protein
VACPHDSTSETTQITPSVGIRPRHTLTQGCRRCRTLMSPLQCDSLCPLRRKLHADTQRQWWTLALQTDIHGQLELRREMWSFTQMPFQMASTLAALPSDAHLPSALPPTYPLGKRRLSDGGRKGYSRQVQGTRRPPGRSGTGLGGTRLRQARCVRYKARQHCQGDRYVWRCRIDIEALGSGTMPPACNARTVPGGVEMKKGGSVRQDGRSQCAWETPTHQCTVVDTRGTKRIVDTSSLSKTLIWRRGIKALTIRTGGG